MLTLMSMKAKKSLVKKELKKTCSFKKKKSLLKFSRILFLFIYYNFCSWFKMVFKTMLLLSYERAWFMVQKFIIIVHVLLFKLVCIWMKENSMFTYSRFKYRFFPLQSKLCCYVNKWRKGKVTDTKSFCILAFFIYF